MEVPDHLLARSRARRAALGLGGDDAAPGNSPGDSVPAPPDVAGSGAVSAATAGAVAAPAPIVKSTPAPPSFTGPKQSPPRHNRVPYWMMPVTAIVPIWAIFYFGAFGSRVITKPLTPVERGAKVFRSAGCSGCHGAAGQGNPAIGAPKLAAGEVVKTFPDEADHVAWVTGGSIGGGQPYGDPAREGGQHHSKGGMPAFGASLSADDIEAVITYEREGL